MISRSLHHLIFMFLAMALPESCHGFSLSTTTGSSTATIKETEYDKFMQNVTSQKYREISHSIAAQFSPTEFNPLPSLRNRHIQTISGVYLRSDDACKYVPSELSLIQRSAQFLGSSLVPSSSNANNPQSMTQILNPDREGFYDERQRFDTPDGDFFDVDFKYQHSNPKDGTCQRPSSRGMVIVLHGLQSNSQSSLSVDMAIAFLNQGFDVACMNFRGCSGEMNRRMGGYHLGFTNDVKQFLEHLRVQRETTKDAAPPLFLSGFSLGSNVVLKALGELGERAHLDYNIYGAAVCGVPFDQERSIDFVQAPGFNSLVYTNFLLKSMKERSLEQMSLFEGSEEWKRVDYNQIIQAESISDIENAVLAPIYGYEDNIDYYRQNSCLRYLDKITVPTFLINAADDPFFDPTVFPWEKSSKYDSNSPIRMLRTDHGGHLGFMFHRANTDEENSFDSSNMNGKGAASNSITEQASWMPSELSRFLRYTYEQREKLDEISSAIGEVKSLVSFR